MSVWGTLTKLCVHVGSYWKEIVYALLLSAIAGTIIPYLYRNLSFSLFYDKSQQATAHTRLLNDNLKRGEHATAYLREGNFSSLFTHANLTNTDYCFVVVTIQRPTETLYLTQTVARLANILLSQMEGRSYSFMVYNAAGVTHSEAVKISQFVPVLSSVLPEAKGLSSYEKEGRDYVTALQLCLKRNATYNIILQDDAVLDWMFTDKLDHVLRYWLPHSNSWAILKLFYPEKYQDWGNDPSMIVELVVVVMVTSILLTLILSVIFPGTFWGQRTTSVTVSVSLRLALSMAFMTFLLLTLGRPHWEELRKLHPLLTTAVPARGCCIPAVLYPITHLKEVVNFLSAVKCSSSYPVDIALDDFAEQKGFGKYLIVPNIARHIGYMSSLPKGFKSIKEFGLLFTEP